MSHNFKLLAVCFVATLCLTSSAAAQRVHQIRLEANAAKETFRFSPALVTARPGDVLLFKAGPGVPHSIVFESGGLSEEARRVGDSRPSSTHRGISRAWKSQLYSSTTRAMTKLS